MRGVCVSGQEPACLQGTWEQMAWALLAEKLLPPLLSLESLAAYIGGGSHFEDLKYPPREEVSGVPTPQHPDVTLWPLAPGRAVHPTTTRTQDPGTAVLTGEQALTSLALGATGAMDGTESD